MTDLTDLNTAAQTLGGKWTKLNSKADGTLEGTVLDFQQRPMTFEGAPTLNRKTGQPRVEWVFTLRVDEPDPGDPVDDGIRKVSFKESAQRAIAAAIRDAGTKASTGDRLKIAVSADPEHDRAQATYQARWAPMATTIDVPSDVDDGDEDLPF